MKGAKGTILSCMKFSEPMARHTTFRIGGPADIWAQPADSDSLKEIVHLCRRDGIGIFAVGNGSNLLVRDKGVSGCVLNLNTRYFKGITIDGTVVTAGAGLGISRLLSALGEEGLTGLEFLVGIPATLGGALAMNSGVRMQIGDFVEEAIVMDNKARIIKLDKKDIAFRYRGSNLEKYIILQARLKLEKSDKNEILNRMRGHLAQKRQTQELDLPSAGCIFKNPAGDSAGRLIDTSGLKGKSVGDAVVSSKHANFIINAGNATCDDVLSLMGVIQEKVKKDHGVELEPEVKIL